jgi:hypothetical protein
LEGLIPVVEGGMHDLKAEVSSLTQQTLPKILIRSIGCERGSENYELSHNSPPK